MKQKHKKQIILEDDNCNILSLNPDGILMEGVTQGYAKFEADGIWMGNIHFVPTLITIGNQQYYALLMKKE